MEKEIRYYVTENGNCPYEDWFNTLDNKTKAIIDNRIERLRIKGHYGDCKKLKNSQLSELRFKIGKGYRIYYKDLTDAIIIILAGGDKDNQHHLIKLANKYLSNFEI